MSGEESGVVVSDATVGDWEEITTDINTLAIQADVVDEINGICEDESTEAADAQVDQTEEKENQRRKKNEFKFKSDPPDLKAAKAKNVTTILENGQFAKHRRPMMFYGRSPFHGQRDDVESEEEEEYTNREFTGAAYVGAQIDSEGERRPYVPHLRHFERRPYVPRFSSERWNRRHDRIPLDDLMSEEDKEGFLKTQGRHLNIFIRKTYQNIRSDAIPEDLIWKSLGKHLPILPMRFICPHSARMKHIEFEKKEIEAEKYRVNLVYKLICQEGIIHIEKLWRDHLSMKRKEQYPFDGYTHFVHFITSRSHIFGMDQHEMVSNRNLLVTVAVLRYVHALHHGMTVQKTPRLFKDSAALLIYRAFLSFMTADNLSFDLFFRKFPSLFEYDEMAHSWGLNVSSVLSIPSAFLPNCIPTRDHITPYTDRSSIFNGTATVTANNVKGLRVLSDDTLHNGIQYVVGIPKNIADDLEKYPVGARVIFSGVRSYSGDRQTVEGTRVELMKDEEEKDDYDGTIDVFTIEEEKEEEKRVETTTESVSDDLIVSQVRVACASREKERKKIIEELFKEKGVKEMEITQMYNHMKYFVGNFNDFIYFIFDRRGIYYKCVEMEGDKTMVSLIQWEVEEKVIEFLTELDRGKEERSFYREEAIEILTEICSDLEEEERFTLEDLREVLIYKKLLIQSPGSRPRMVTTVSPRLFWDSKCKTLFQV